MDGIRLFLIPWFLELFSFSFAQRVQNNVPDFNSHFQNIFHQPHGHFLDHFPAFEPFHLHPAFPVLHPTFGTHTGLGLLMPSSNSLASSPSKARNIFLNNLSSDKTFSNQIITHPRLVPYEAPNVNSTTVAVHEISKHKPPRARATLVANTETTTTIPFTSTIPIIQENKIQTTGSVKHIEDIITTTLSKKQPDFTTTKISESTQPIVSSTAAFTTTTIPLTTPLTLGKEILPEAENETSENFESGIIQNKRTSNIFLNETDESRINLKKHLNNPELKGLLSSANLSIEDAQVFLKLVEKVLEEEVAKRVKDKEEEKVVLNFSENSALHEPSESGNPVEQIPVNENEEIPSTENHELKTVNTRLGFESVEMEALSESPPGIPKLSIREDSKPETEAFNIGPNIETVQTKIEDTSLLEKVPTDVDYRDREQAAFDRLVGSANSGIPPINTDKKLRIDILEYKKDPTSIRSLSYAAPKFQAPRDGTILVHVDSKNEELGEFSSQPLQRRNMFKSHQSPKTPFESLVKDYEYRLSGVNGINDIVKALRNAHIGIYERPTFYKFTNGPRAY